MFDSTKKQVDLDTLTEYHRQLVSIINTSNSGNQVSTMPTASATWNGKVVQYVGTTDANYTNGYFYQCVNNNGTYSWTAKYVQEGGSSSGAEYPSGGTTGQALIKKSNADNDVEWGNVSVTVDSSLSSSSENPVQNKVVNAALAGKQDTLTQGTNISISNGTISATDTTYSTVSKSAAGLCPQLPNENTTTKFLRQDGSWVAPATGSSNFNDLNNRPETSGTIDMSEVVTPMPSSISVYNDRACVAAVNRWLRFDPSNKKGLIIKAGTIIRLANGTMKTYSVDTQVDLTSYISTAGADYFVYLANDGTVSAYTTKQSDKGVQIGRFHTLCANVGSNVTMIAPASANSGLTTSNTYLIKAYNQNEDPDFYAFYNKQIKSISANAKYDVVTVAHPLSGFVANDILPESVFCLTWHPDCLIEDAMVYDKNTDIVVDVYLQSGTGEKTRSKYNAVHTVNREPENHFWDLQQVGKKPLTDIQFTSIAIGSNECTNIVGSTDKSTVGGHADTAGRRMISAIGVEEACGYIWQWLENLVGWTTGSWGTRDGRGSFGQEYGDTYVLLAGGYWDNGSHCGSRCRGSDGVRSGVYGFCGSRGSSLIVTK